LPIPKTGLNAPPFIAAVHPTDGKKIFVRTDEWINDNAGATMANDALFYTKDGGMTWTELLRPTGDTGGAKLFGFAVSPDGGTLLAGYGDPVLGGGRNVNPDVLGVYKSSGADYSFGATPKAVFVESATCLTWTAKGIYVCGSPQGTTSYVSFASDVNNVTSAGLKKIMDVNQLKGEPPCCNGRAVTTCNWETDCQRFQACIDGGSSTVDAGVCTMPEAGRPDSGTDGSGGAGGAATGGTGGATTGGTGGAATGGTGGATSTGTGGTAGSGGSCSCRTVGGSNGTGAPALGVLFGLIGAGGWRRSRRQRRIA
jgi:MYXO-CTERM domain-containing protein